MAGAGQISRAASVVGVEAADALDAASVGGGGIGDDRDAVIDVIAELAGPEVVDGVFGIFDRGDQVV